MSAWSGVALVTVMLCAAMPLVQPESDVIVELAREGWNSARDAATSGGTPEALAPAARALASLDKVIEGSPWQLQGTYARSLVAAAMAAAQDERAEMQVHLTHAAELSARLETSAYPAMWPLRFHRAAGELWLEVDDYPEALKAFQRAVARAPDAPAWHGLARSAARLGDTERACQAYRHVSTLAVAEAERQEARDYLARCP